jgi:cellulose biosynthesis protein BcsQ
LVSDAVIIPIQPSPLDLWATSDTLRLAEEATGIKVFHNHIKQRVAFAEVMAEGKTVMEMKDPHDKANAEFGQLLVEILLWAEVTKSYQGRSYPRARKLRERFLQSVDLDSIIKEYKDAGNDQWQLILWVKRWLNS